MLNNQRVVVWDIQLEIWLRIKICQDLIDLGDMCWSFLNISHPCFGYQNFDPFSAWIFVIWEVLQVTATKKSHVKTETWNPENQPRMGWCSTMGIKAKQMEQMGAKSCHWLVMACRLSWLVHPRVIFDHKHMRPGTCDK